MRIGLIWISQETDTFNPTPTTVESFAAFGIDRGDAIIENLGTVGMVGGYLEAARGRGDVETVPIFKARSVAGGRLSSETLAFLSHELEIGLRSAGPLDGLALQLHGACAADGVDDVEGHLLAVAREVLGDSTPIVISLDHHANVTQAMVDLSSAIVGHRTQPHDQYDTGVLGAQMLFRIVAGEVDPVTAWRKIPLLSHQEQYLTSKGPMKVWFDRARALESIRAIVQISNFPMQPWLDLEEGGWATVVVADGDSELAEAFADELAALAWSMREEFQQKSSVSPAEAVGLAVATEGLVILSDTGDSVLGGAGGDSTVLLREMMTQGVEGSALVPIVDPIAAAELAGLRQGGSVTVQVGGRVAAMHEPVTISGTLRLTGEMTVEVGGGYASPVVDLGVTAVVDTEIGTVVITEMPGVGGVHPDMYLGIGIDPSDYGMVVVKTASNFQYFAAIASAVVRADTSGPTQSDIGSLDWKRIPRPIYPLDDLQTWQ